MGWWEQGRAGGQPWLPAPGDEIPFGVSLGNPGTGKHHLCNSLNSNSWLHSESRVWDTRSRYLEETLAGRLPWRGLRGSAWPWGTVTGVHWSWDAVTTVTISPGDVLRLQTSPPSQAPSSAHNAPVFQAQHGRGLRHFGSLKTAEVISSHEYFLGSLSRLQRLGDKAGLRSVGGPGIAEPCVTPPSLGHRGTCAASSHVPRPCPILRDAPPGNRVPAGSQRCPHHCPQVQLLFHLLPGKTKRVEAFFTSSIRKKERKLFRSLSKWVLSAQEGFPAARNRAVLR